MVVVVSKARVYNWNGATVVVVLKGFNLIVFRLTLKYF